MKNKLLALLGLAFIAMAATAPDIETALLFLSMGVLAVVTAHNLLKEIIKNPDQDINEYSFVDFYGDESPFKSNVMVEYFVAGYKHKITQMSDLVIWEDVINYRAKID